MEKALILRFRDARVWCGDNKKDKNNDKTKDKYFYNIQKIRAGYEYEKISYSFSRVPLGTLHYCTISNALHVLAGERPVPHRYSSHNFMKLRQNYYHTISYIEDLAKRSYVNIDTPIVGNGYTKEISAVRKAIDNCYEPFSCTIKVGSKDVVLSGAVPDWHTIASHLSCNGLFTELHSILNELCGGECLNESFISMMEKFGEHPRIKKFSEKCKENKRSVFHYLICPEKYISQGKSKPDPRNFVVHSGHEKDNGLKVARLVVRGIKYAHVLSGRIVVPVTNELIKKISNGPGFSTLLEGGTAHIENISLLTPNLVSSYQKVYTGEE